MLRVAVVGAWHSAHITAACLAHLGHHVTLVNPGPESWAQYPMLGLDEPGLRDLVGPLLGQGLGHGNFYPLSDHSGPPSVVDVVWLAIDTPLRSDGSPDVTELLRAIDRSKELFASSKALLVIGSQVPIGFCQKVEGSGAWSVVHVPENLQLGKAVRGFLDPDRIVIGATDSVMGDAVQQMMPNFPERVIRCDLPTAEMIKHATNAFLATSISLANELAIVGERYGADGELMARALKLDSRIGRKAYVRPGMGFSGGHLSRDLYALQTAWVEKNQGGVLPLISVLAVNDNVMERIAQTAVELLPPAPRTLCILGYTYKADTDSLEVSPAQWLARRIREIGRGQAYAEREPVVLGGAPLDVGAQDVNVLGYDRRFNCRREELQRLGLGPAHMPAWIAVERKPDLPGGVDEFLVVTPLPEFKKLDWSKCAPAIVYDLCDGVDRQAVLAAGLRYKAIWRPEASC